MSDSDDLNGLKGEMGTRRQIGVVNPESKSSVQKPEGLTEQQNALREAVINNFKANKVRAFITKQIEYVNSNRQVADGIRFLFDEHGNPPANAPLEDIIEERRKIEIEIRWFEAMCSELRHKLVQIQEIEELALDWAEQNKE